MIFPDLPWVHAAGDGGPRATTQMIVIHATDNTASDENEASYASHRPDQISAHFFVDGDSVIQCLDTSHVAYGCFPTGNSRSVQFELCGPSGHITDAVMRQAAPIVGRVCREYGIPVWKVGPAELRAGTRGICGHGDVTQAWGEGDHTDPGAFAWDKFIGYVANGGDMTTLAQDPDGQWMYPRIQAIAQLARPDRGPEKGADLAFVTWTKQVSADLAAIRARIGGDLVDEDAIIRGVLAGLPADRIATAVAAALPADEAQRVVDELAARIAATPAS